MKKEKSESSGSLKTRDAKSNKKKKEDSKKVKEKAGPKAIDTTKVAYTVLGLVIIGGLILYSSGIFDQPAVTESSQQQFDDFHKGADLSQLEEINKLREQVQNNPENHEAMLHLAHKLNDSGFKQEAINWYKEYLKTHPDVADVWVDMGVCYFDMNNFDEATKAMKKGIEIEPNHQIGHFNLGIVNYTKGDVAKAKEWWNKAIEINPSSNIASRAKELIQNN